MNTLVIVFALVALASASVGPHGGAVLKGPSGVVTSHGAIGPDGLPNGVVSGPIGVSIGHGLGYGGIVAAPALAAPVAVAAPAVVAAPAIGAYGLGAGLGLGHGIGLGGLGGLGGYGGLGHGFAAGIVTNGGGTIGVSGHGATVQGPPTAPAVISGPSGKVAADGLWGPTATWATGGHGAYGAYGHGGHGW